MGNDIGFIGGTVLIMGFGFLIAFVLPNVFKKEESLSEENLRALNWIKWLGITLIFISILLIIALVFLP